MIIIGRVAGYEFDVFISYSNRGSAPRWLMNHFYPKFLDCLADQIAPAPKVFVDKRMARGTHWPSDLENALHRSKIMLAVLAPPYFESSWCMAELRSMHAREKLLGLAGAGVPQGLIYPILYSDSENFPMEEGLERSWWSFKELGTPELVFRECREWNTFHQEVSNLATDLVSLLKQVPDWRPDWPVIERPKPVLMRQPPIPRFG